MYLRKWNISSRKWMCKKQTSVSRSSSESDIISLDAGLRMDGILALDLWDVVIEVLHSSNNKTSSTQEASGNSLYMLNTKLTKKVTTMLISCQI